jgi:ADP-ribose pyrophosphatase
VIEPRRIRKLFEGPSFTLQIESTTLPNGRVIDAEVVRHPGSVVIVPITPNGEVILVRQYRHTLGRYTWELPAGTLKPAEDVRDAAVRECHEEVGLVADHIEHVGSFFPAPGYSDEQMHFFVATRLRAPTSADPVAERDEDEDIEPRPFKRADIAAMVGRGDIVDLKTLGGLTLTQTKNVP